MKNLVYVAAITLLSSVPAVVSADEGGQPNDNAYTQTGNGDPNGRKGTCVPPGSVFKITAKADGPNTFAGGPPGQAVKAQCSNAPS